VLSPQFQLMLLVTLVLYLQVSLLFWHAPALAPQKPAEEPAPLKTEAPAAKKSTAEIDLSEEWDVEITDTAPVPKARTAGLVPKPVAEIDAETISETVEEVRFYLSQSMIDQAQDGLRKLEKLKADPAILSDLRRQIEAASPKSKPAAKESISLDEIEVISDLDSPVPFPQTQIPPSSLNDYVSGMGSQRAELTAHAPAQPTASTGGLDDLVADLESSLSDSFLGDAGSPQLDIKPQPAPIRTAGSAAAPAPAMDPLPVPSSFSAQPRPLVPSKPLAAPAGPGVDISDMFSELKQDLETDTNVATEDPETHYNLGVAFREMGLLDEAISELQKVCQAVERGNPFPHLMQAYTWLAQCFLDKGIPEAAIRWYEKALALPGIDGDTCTALHYELGSAYEAGQNKPLALKHFMEVYGSNIDYRDVAERIKALKS